MSRRRGRLGVFLRRPRHSSPNELCLRTHEGSGPVNENLPEGGRHGRPPQQESHIVDAKKKQQLHFWQINQASSDRGASGLTQGPAGFVLVGADVIPVQRKEEESDYFIRWPFAIPFFPCLIGSLPGRDIMTALQETLMELKTPPSKRGGAFANCVTWLTHKHGRRVPIVNPGTLATGNPIEPEHAEPCCFTFKQTIQSFLKLLIY